MELRWSDGTASPLFAGISFKFKFMPAADRRRSDTDNRPMLDPREGLGDVVAAMAGGAFGEAEGMLRYGIEEEIEEERDGGRELRSGDIWNGVDVE